MVSQRNFLKHLGVLLFPAVFIFGPAVGEMKGQSVEARLKLEMSSPEKISVEVEGPPTNSWSFRNSYAGMLNLGRRIGNFELIDPAGQEVFVQAVAPGEFRADRRTRRFRYEVSVAPPVRLSDMSHISWIKGDQGLLMLADLLPQFTPPDGVSHAYQIEMVLPDGWSVLTSAKANGNGYSTSDPDDVVFFVGHDLRKKTVRMGSMELSLVTVGKWNFTDDEVLKIAEKVLREYLKVTRYYIPTTSFLMLAPFGGAVGADRWSAETRGSTVVLLLGRESSRSALLGRLKVVLTHELFHLWVPKALTFTGDYDWFFEGFTLYQALLTALRLRSITFAEYLETLSRVYDSYRSSPERDKLSLLEASERRWTTGSSFVYEKGLLVAFVYDLLLRSYGKRSTISDLYPQLFRAPATTTDGNELIMSILDKQPGMDRFSDRFVRSAGGFDLPPLLAPFGISIEMSGQRTRFVVSKDLNAEQRRLLRSLGYK